jgi:hypothetical protein
MPMPPTPDHAMLEPCDDGTDWRVTQCACGQLTLRLGHARFDFSREEFAELYRLVQHAMVEFQITESRRTVHHVRATTAH